MDEDIGLAIYWISPLLLDIYSTISWTNIRQMDEDIGLAIY